MLLLRRFLVFAALFFWQGGFTFYASVVVPVGQQELGSHREQGFITRRVSNYLNLAGAVCLIPLAWDAAVGAGRSRWRRRVRWAAWSGMAAGLLLLLWLHGRLDDLLDPEAHRILDRAAFRFLHRCYLLVSTFQWCLALLYTLVTLAIWRSEDRRVPARAERVGEAVLADPSLQPALQRE